MDGKETSVEVEKGKALGDKLPEAPVKKGFTFKEWNTEKDGTGTKVTENTVVNEEMTVYAVFEKNSEPTEPENPDSGKPEKPEKPENPDSGKPEKPEKPNSGKPSKPDTKPNKQNPVKTGDTQSPIWYLGLMAAAGALIAGKRKKKED